MAVHRGTGDTRRRRPAKRFAWAARELAEQDFVVAVVGGGQHRETTGAVMRFVPSRSDQGSIMGRCAQLAGPQSRARHLPLRSWRLECLLGMRT